VVCIIVSIIDSIIDSISSIRSSTSGNSTGTCCTQSTSASKARSYTIVIIGNATSTW